MRDGAYKTRCQVSEIGITTIRMMLLIISIGHLVKMTLNLALALWTNKIHKNR